VTGGARGLGLAVGSAFASEGATVVLVDLDPGVEGVARSVGAEGFVADVTDFDAMRGLAALLKRRLGRCDHLVHAAAVGSGKFGFPFWNLDPGDWEQVLRVNLVGAVNVAHAFAPWMAETRAGTMLFVASVAGQIGSQTDPPYSASKAGLINFAQCAAKDLAPFGVRVNALCPGMVKTALNRSVYDAWAALQPEARRSTFEAWADEKVRKLVPLGRCQEADDVASMAVFLASPQAKNVTGQTVNVDGGYVMHW
jgi:NAD(P)-dependent dehydrogenase (short-subunit alcohol dehydrogenase family)